MNINHNLKETNIDDIDVKSQLEHHIKIQKTKESAWIFDRFNSVEIRFYKTGDLNGSSFVKIPLSFPALKNIKNDDKKCFIGQN